MGRFGAYIRTEARESHLTVGIYGKINDLIQEVDIFQFLDMFA